ncbi:LacI family DNA-binding transcriptional regulator [Sphingorhabdus sp. Alg231-15]|uniref:LacI family DNA-binding transcriptional regulator n=1 Tax=Sphingorhabdus sp. Alg231-15 TaxID=1922222 RepID=UPI000D5523F0
MATVHKIASATNVRPIEKKRARNQKAVNEGSAPVLNSAPKKAVTSIDVAKKVGCAPTTVSRALRGSSQVSDFLRDKIIRISEEMNYHPNTAASSLRKSAFKNIAIIAGDKLTGIRNTSANRIFRVLEALRENAQRHGYTVSLHIVDDDDFRNSKSLPDYCDAALHLDYDMSLDNERFGVGAKANKVASLSSFAELKGATIASLRNHDIAEYAKQSIDKICLCLGRKDE